MAAMLAARPTGPAGPAGPTTTGRVLRPRSSIAAMIVGLVAALAWAWSAAADGGVLGLARQAPDILLATTLAYGVLVRPAVAIGPTGITLRNVVRDVDVPWAALAEVRTRFALTLVTTDGRRFTAWAAPASGRHTDTRLTRRELGAIGWDPADDLPTASASPESSSGAVAAWVRREWSRSIEADAHGGPGSRLPAALEPRTRTHLARGVVGLLSVATVLVAVTMLA